MSSGPTQELFGNIIYNPQMAMLNNLALGEEKEIDLAEIELRCRNLWDDLGIYRHDATEPGEIFSIDTPPPYVSAAHLHVGHAMSYSQAEFIVRYQRMRGKKIFYPMGFDDNGLPTERYVEQTYRVNKSKISRTEFRRLCLEETRKAAVDYEKLWRALGISVDWSLRYSTIDDHCRRTAQLSFLDLYRKNRVYRSDEPVIWDTHFETSLAQADLDNISRKSVLHDIVFTGPDNHELVISTTRPELLAGCVALYAHSSDERYRSLIGRLAKVPIFGHEVPILADEDVEKEFGTGLMMVCTFGDAEDVKRWKRDNLATRLCIATNGRMTEQAQNYVGLTVEECRKSIVQDLKERGLYRRATGIEQNVTVAERSGTPIEFVMVPQWFIRILDLKPELLKRSDELRWYPSHMKIRLDDWINGLKYDWNISRQRFYGVPFPLWYCGNCNEVILAPEKSLPIDPLEEPCPIDRCPACNHTSFRGESDVMDTWMTSSLTPLINANWAGSEDRKGNLKLYPMTVRVQAFEIIRTWLFYTILKAHLHTASLPWRDVMISGWGLNEQGQKISKRHLEDFTNESGYNRYDPYSVILKYGADALRYWSAGSHLGNNLRYNEKDVKVGRKLVIKLWNVARFCLMYLKDFDPHSSRPPFKDRATEDRWVLRELNLVIPKATEGFDHYNYAVVREAVDRFFWATFCDDYLEMIKGRFWTPELYSEASRFSAQSTLWESLRIILALYAPLVPFITEEMYQKIYRPFENSASIHVTSWPVFDEECLGEIPEMKVISQILYGVRSLRSHHKISQTRKLEALVVDVSEASPETCEIIESMKPSIQGATRVGELRYGPASIASEVDGVRLDLVLGEKQKREELTFTQK